MNLCSDKLNEYNKLSAIQKNLYCYLDEYKNKKIVLLYSGNYDSHVLFTALCLFKDKLGLDFKVLHFLHGSNLSDKTSMNIVQSQCVANQIDFEIVNAFISNETQGRESRQNFLKNNLKDDEFVVLTAHHLDDVVETFLINLFNGTSYNGLSGISDNLKIDGILYLRPFIYFNAYKKDLEFYKGRYMLPLDRAIPEFVEDAMNGNLSFKRNLVRDIINRSLRLFPFLKNKIIDFTLYAKQQNNINVFCYKQTDYLLNIANNSYSLSTVKHFLENNEDVMRNWFFMLFKDKFKVNLTIRHFEEFKRFINDNAKIMSLPNNLKITVAANVLVFSS